MSVIDGLFTLDSDTVPEERPRLQLTRGTFTFTLAIVLFIAAVSTFTWSAFASAVEFKYFLRELAVSAAAFAVPIAFIGIVVTLPTNSRALAVSIASSLLCSGAIVWFIIHYPYQWDMPGAMNALVGVLVYSAGIIPLALLTLVALNLYLVEKSVMLLIPEEVREESNITREQVRQHIRRLVMDDPYENTPGPNPGLSSDSESGDDG